MTEYSMGFCFNETMSLVALIEKQKPLWQKGKLNGIGGHIEVGETPYDAMRREFKEEAGADIVGWDKFAELEGKDFRVHCFFTRATDLDFDQIRTMTGERVRITGVDPFILNANQGQGGTTAIPNVPWLMLMAKSFTQGERANSFKVMEN